MKNARRQAENARTRNLRKARGADARTAKTKDEWLTPPALGRSLGSFDLDPCAPVRRPWPTALAHFTIEDDGLAQKWFGRVWLNPPYGAAARVWIEKLAAHGNGIALVAARTQRLWFQSAVKQASAVLFLKGSITYHHVDGSLAPAAAPFPNVLIAFGEENAFALQLSNLPGLLYREPTTIAA
jgi:hypothetical protein